MLRRLSLQNFRSYTKAAFTFDKNTTLFVGPNTIGKTNLIEAIFFLASGKSFRAEKDIQAIQFNKELARIKGDLNQKEETSLEVILTQGSVGGRQTPFKRYLVNGIAKRRVDFTGHFTTVLFSPSDLETIIASPGVRREFLDTVLEQTDRTYRLALTLYVKALRQRNALLERVQETGHRDERLFSYWNELLITNGQLITQKRESFIQFVNKAQKDISSMLLTYDKSTISEERLLQYKDAEVASGVTLVGPHRDDFFIEIVTNDEKSNIKFFGSRGQQRLAVLQLKLLQLAFMEKVLDTRPLLLLDDIFSELDNNHIKLVLDIISKQQTIITTTHKEFVDQKTLSDMDVIELERN